MYHLFQGAYHGYLPGSKGKQVHRWHCFLSSLRCKGIMWKQRTCIALFLCCLCLSKKTPFPLARWFFSEIPRAVPRQQADAHPAGEFGRQRPHHHGHLLLPCLLQWVRNQIHSHVWTEVSGLTWILFQSSVAWCAAKYWQTRLGLWLLGLSRPCSKRFLCVWLGHVNVGWWWMGCKEEGVAIRPEQAMFQEVPVCVT